MQQHRPITRSVADITATANRTISRPLDGPPDDWAVLPFQTGEDTRGGVAVRT